MDFHQKVFDGVFELPLLRTAHKRKKKRGEKEKEVLTYYFI
jgi:hypothetical protein